MIFPRKFLTLVLTAFMAAPVLAQAPKPEAPTFDVTGRLQVRASAGISRATAEDILRIGFGIRRARIAATARFGPRAGLVVQVDGAGGAFSVVDFHAAYRLSDRVRVRVGRMVSAQPRSLILTSQDHIDAVERAAIAERWSPITIGSDGRDFGLDIRYLTSQVELIGFLHNGDGSWNRARGNYRSSVSGGSATDGIDRTTIAVTGAVAFRPASIRGLEIGGFAGYNPSGNPNTERLGVGREYATYGAHAYLGANPGSRRVRLKFDAIGTTFEALRGEETQQSAGVSVLAALGIARGAEFFVRAEALETDVNGPDDADGYFTAGFSVSPSARRGGEYRRERLTLAWTRFTAGARGSQPEDLLALQLQLVF